MEFDITTWTGKEEAMDAYRLETSSNYGLPFKTFCDNHGIEYRRLLDWCHRQRIYINDIKYQRKETRLSQPFDNSTQNSFIQFIPAHRPSTVELHGISITFPDGVNLTLQESSVESLISLLTIYQARQGGIKECSD